MIWTTSTIDKLIDCGAPIELQRAINDKLPLLIRICGEHVPAAPAPMVDWNDADQELRLHWHWLKQNRSFALVADAGGTLRCELFLSKRWVEQGSPTDEQVTQSLLTFFEGYDPQ